MTISTLVYATDDNARMRQLGRSQSFSIRRFINCMVIVVASIAAEGRADEPAATHKPLKTIQSPTFVFAMSFSLDGRTLIAGGGTSDEASLLSWDISSGRQIASFEGHVGYIYDLSIAPDGKSIAAAGRDKTVKIWDVSDHRRKETLSGHEGYATCIAFSPDGKRLASGGWDKAVMLWDIPAGVRKTIHSSKDFSVSAIAFSPEGRDLVFASGKDVKKLDATTGRVLGVVDVGSVGLNDVAWSSDGKAIVGGISSRGLVLIDPVTMTIKKMIPSNGVIQSTAISPDSLMVAAGTGSVVRIWQLATGKLLAEFAGHEQLITSVCFSPDGTTIAAAASKSIRIWKTP